MFQWGRPGRFPSESTCEESKQTFLELPAIKTIMVVTVVGSGTSTVGPGMGKQAIPSINDERPGENTFSF